MCRDIVDFRKGGISLALCILPLLIEELDLELGGVRIGDRDIQSAVVVDVTQHASAFFRLGFRGQS